jgi:hypothetical protein
VLYSTEINEKLIAFCIAEAAEQGQTRQGGKGLADILNMVEDSVVSETCFVVSVGAAQKRQGRSFRFMRGT